MAMNLGQAEKAMQQIIRLGGKYGASSENNKVAAYINKVTRKRFAAHKSPSGKAWPKTKSRKVRIGQLTVVGRDRRPGSRQAGKRIIRKVSSAQEAARLNRSRPGALPALARGGKFPARKLRNAYTKKSAPGHIQRPSKSGLVIGSSWRMAEGMQFGIGKRKIPARQFYGISEKDLKAILQIYLIGYMFQIEKATGSKIKMKDFTNKITA